jgi:hypothetical protein
MLWSDDERSLTRRLRCNREHGLRRVVLATIRGLTAGTL